MARPRVGDGCGRGRADDGLTLLILSAEISVRARARAAGGTGWVFPVGAAPACRAWRITVAITPPAIAARVPIPIGAAPIVVPMGDVIVPPTAVGRCARSAAPARWVLPIRAGAAAPARRVVVAIAVCKRRCGERKQRHRCRKGCYQFHRRALRFDPSHDQTGLGRGSVDVKNDSHFLGSERRRATWLSALLRRRNKSSMRRARKRTF